MEMKSKDPSAPVAHTPNFNGDWHALAHHLDSVAEHAKAAAAAFGAGEIAYLAGIWHDLGKYHPAFQQYLLDAHSDPGKHRRGPDHKAAGTCLAAGNPNLQILAFVIMGHHGGLPDMSGRLRSFIQEHCATDRISETLGRASRELRSLDPPADIEPPSFITRPEEAELFIRMVFSALVDADVRDTQNHHAGAEPESLDNVPTIIDLFAHLEQEQRQLVHQSLDTPLNAIRNEIYDHCLRAGDEPQGAFRLTVPTGGGKTRSGVAFALRHATKHDLRRVIVAVPYTSITEQTADTYRRIFGQDRFVLEHHSAVDPEERENDVDRDWAERAAENWDAPLIVTTTVQLLESLFANRTSRCRKLHNIARSVIVLDEVQSLPPGLIQPTLDVLHQLVHYYGVTVVFSTATQPALDERVGFPGIPGIKEIIPNPSRYFERLRRVEFHKPDEPLSWNAVAREMQEHRQALAILNTRADTRALFEELDDPDALHLSTLMCGVHRRTVLATIRDRLARGQPCRVVSTQLVEAGVDLDFPVVLRAIGPLDRIVQAAGRCNREGLRDAGKVVIFESAEGASPQGEYRTGTDIAQTMLRQGDNDLHDPETYRRFFERLYRSVSLDSKNVQGVRQALDFPSVAERYRIIDQRTVPVLVPYGDAHQTGQIDRLLNAFDCRTDDPRRIWRQLQALTVSLSSWQLDNALRRGIVAPVRVGLWRTTPQAVYHPKLGLLLDEADAGALVF